MRIRITRFIALVLLLGCLAFGACAWAEAIDAYTGIWVADGVRAEIWREEEEPHCRVVFPGEDGESVIWAYSGCWYDKESGILRLGGVTRTREHLDPLWDTLVEDDWSLNDMCFATLETTESGIRLRDDDRETTIDFVRLDAAEPGERGKALAFVGRWENESVTLRVEDHGVAYLFEIIAPMDGGSRCKWWYTCRFDAEAGRMVSVDVSNRRVITPTQEGGTIEEDVGYIHSEAVFTLEAPEQLIWSDVTDGDGEEMAFRRVGD